MLQITLSMLLLAITILVLTGSAAFAYLLIDSIKTNKEIKKYESDQNSTRY